MRVESGTKSPEDESLGDEEEEDEWVPNAEDIENLIAALQTSTPCVNVEGRVGELFDTANGVIRFPGLSVFEEGVEKPVEGDVEAAILGEQDQAELSKMQPHQIQLSSAYHTYMADGDDAKYSLLPNRTARPTLEVSTVARYVLKLNSIASTTGIQQRRHDKDIDSALQVKVSALQLKVWLREPEGRMKEWVPSQRVSFLRSVGVRDSQMNLMRGRPSQNQEPDISTCGSKTPPLNRRRNTVATFSNRRHSVSSTVYENVLPDSGRPGQAFAPPKAPAPKRLRRVPRVMANPPAEKASSSSSQAAPNLRDTISSQGELRVVVPDDLRFQQEQSPTRR